MFTTFTDDDLVPFPFVLAGGDPARRDIPLAPRLDHRRSVNDEGPRQDGVGTSACLHCGVPMQRLTRSTRRFCSQLCGARAGFARAREAKRQPKAGRS